MTLALPASAQRLSLNDLLLQIQQQQTMMCGNVDLETCAVRVAPSALERIESLEGDNVALTTDGISMMPPSPAARWVIPEPKLHSLRLMSSTGAVRFC